MEIASSSQVADYIERGLEFVARGEVIETRFEFFTKEFPLGADVLGIALIGKEGGVERALISVVKTRASKASDFARLIGITPDLARWMSGAHLMNSEEHPRKTAHEIMMALRDGSP